MKLIIKPFIFSIIIAITSACSTTYYQSYFVEYSEIPKPNSDITVSYDFWEEGGIMRFTITNNTDKVITIKWDKSFFILNGLSIPYFKNKEQSEGNSIAVGSPVGIHVKSTSTTVKPDREIMIAPTGMYPFATYGIQTSFIHSDISTRPKKKSPVTKEFTTTTTPITFTNFVTYQIEGEQQSKTFGHSFYVKKMSNMHYKDFSSQIVWSRPGEAPSPVTYHTKSNMAFFYTYYD